MPEPYLLFALAASVLHAFSSVYSKRLHGHGQTPLKVAFYSLFGCAAVSLLAAPWVPPPDLSRAPGLVLIMGAAVAAGHMCFISAVQAGDASFVVPMLGLKVFFVAVISALLIGEVYGPLVYLGGVGAVVGMFLLGDGRLRATARPLALVLAATLLFGLTDVLLIFLFRAGYTPVEVMVYMFVLSALILLPAAVVLLRGNYRMPWPFARSLVTFATFQLLGGVCLMTAFALSQQPTMVNIVQSARGLFAVLLVYGLGRAGLGGLERLSRHQYRRRIAGALLMTGSVALAVLAR